MSSKAWAAFKENAEDVTRLLQIHADVGGDAKGRRFGLEVLNKSAIVLITAIWEAYCEDIAAEALAHIVAHAKSSATLPKEFKKRLAAEIRADKNELAMWNLADQGWRAQAQGRLAAMMQDRNRKLNTPRADQINELFASAIGLPDVSDAWHWKKMSAANARVKLDKYVTLRGAIAHRGASASTVKKAQVTDYFQLVRKIASWTGGRVNSHVFDVTGKRLW
jgi:hypothetical protein